MKLKGDTLLTHFNLEYSNKIFDIFSTGKKYNYLKDYPSLRSANISYHFSSIDELIDFFEMKRFAFYQITTTDGMFGSNACGDDAVAPSVKQEAHRSLADG